MKMGSTILLSILLAGCGAQTGTAIVTTPIPKVPTSPTATLDSKIALHESIIQVLGPGNREIPRLTKISYSTPEAGDITITWTINENGSPVSRKAAAQTDATNILKVLEQNKTRFIYVILIGTFSIQDEHGNTAETQAINLGFNKSKLDKVNWEDFQPSDVYDLADVADVMDDWK
jgi:hypothetical protein